MKKWRNHLDEMQEQKLLQIEHTGFLLAFFGLFAASLVQAALFPLEPRYAAGEWIVFLAIGLYVGIRCARNGIWSRYIMNNKRSALIAALLAGLFVAVFTFATTYVRYGTPLGALAAGIIGGVVTFLLALAALLLSGRYTRKRNERLEEETEEE